MYELTVQSNFSAAHNLRGYEGACENLHGHNWRVEVTIASAGLDKLGMVMDFKKIKALLKPVIDRLDHKYINETPPFDKINPTAELLAKYIHAELKRAIRAKGVRVALVKVWESETSCAAYHE